MKPINPFLAQVASSHPTPQHKATPSPAQSVPADPFNINVKNDPLIDIPTTLLKYIVYLYRKNPSFSQYCLKSEFVELLVRACCLLMMLLFSLSVNFESILLFSLQAHDLYFLVIALPCPAC